MSDNPNVAMLREILDEYPAPNFTAERAALTAAIAALEAQASAPEHPEAAEVCAMAYQVVGFLLSDVGAFDTELGGKILDCLSEHRMVHPVDEILPWPSFQQASAPGEVGEDDAFADRVLAAFVGRELDPDDTRRSAMRRAVRRARADGMVRRVLAAHPDVDDAVTAGRLAAVDGEAEELALWLDAKYRRHGEEEDDRAAKLIRRLAARTGKVEKKDG